MQPRPAKLDQPIQSIDNTVIDTYFYHIDHLFFGETAEAAQKFYDAHQELKKSGQLG